MKNRSEKKNYLVIEDGREQIVRSDVWKADDDHALFHFTSGRTLNHNALADCFFLEIFIDHRTQWGAPIPSTFQKFFPELLAALVPSHHSLVLNIFDPYEGYFDEQQFIKTFIEPKSLLHFFLDKEIGGRNVPTLFFDCPLGNVSILDDVAFPGTVIDVEGFVMKDPQIELFKKWHEQGNTDSMFRQLLRRVNFAFRMWRDFNGFFVVTDKFDSSGIRRTLNSSSLKKRIGDYVANYKP
jgi:hypothetical protein